MATGEIGQVIPATAWEQAVFVVLFVVFVLYLLNWFSKQQRQWQDFINKRDTDWQAWMDKNETRIAEKIREMSEILERIGNQLSEHDKHVDERIDKAAGSKPTAQRKRTP